MFEAHVLQHFHLSPTTTRVCVVSSWHWLPGKPTAAVLIPPREQPPVHGTLLVAVPHQPGGQLYRILLFSVSDVARGEAVFAAHPQATTVRHRMRQLAVHPANRKLEVWQWPPRPIELPFNHLDLSALAQEMSMDTLKRALALSLQATAEWHVHAASVPKGTLTEEVLAQYSTPEMPQAHSLFTMFVLPYTHGARPGVSKVVKKMFPRRAGLKCVLWRDGALTNTVKIWLASATIPASCFALTCSVNELRRQRLQALDKHEAWCRRGDRLPEAAYAWINKSRAPADNLLTALTEGTAEKDLWVRAHQHIRADIARWCVARAPRPSDEHWSDQLQQYLEIAGPFVEAWDQLLHALPYYRSPEERVVGWGTLAQSMALLSGERVLQRDLIDKTRATLANKREAREKQLAYNRELGAWDKPTDANRRERFAAMQGTTPVRLQALLLTETTPPCLRSVLERGRREHHLIWEDRRILAQWLIAIQPAMERPPEMFTLLAHFALGIDLAHSPTDHREQVEQLVGHLTHAAALRVKNPKFAVGSYCTNIITKTLTTKETRFAARCPYAALRTVSADGKSDVKGCANACAEASGAPLVWHPLDRVLWRKDMDKSGALEW